MTLKSNPLLLMAATSAMIAAGSNATEKTTTYAANEIFFADPTIYVENGKYYMTGTRQGQPKGFAMLESDNLERWAYVSPDSMILSKGPRIYGDQGFWAPQILKDGNVYHFAYTANEQTAIAFSENVNGPYRQIEIGPIDNSEKNIDPFIFKDDDGRCYLYHVRFDNGNFIWVSEFDLATGKIKKGSLSRCFINDQPWEDTGTYPSVPIMEGPTLIKLDETYYLFYSANHFMSEDYAVGYATAPTPVGPWTKNPANPIISRKILGENGSGHGDIFVDNDGNLRYVYHVHNSDSGVSPRRTRIVSLNLRKDSAKGLYDITANPATIIHPLR